MNKGIGRGAIVLIISGLICKIFGALFRLPLTNIIGIHGIGVFQIIISLYAILLIIVSTGVTNALSKLVASARASGKNFKIGNFYKSAIVFSLSLSFVFSLVFIFFSKQISFWQGIENEKNSYYFFVLLLPLGAFIGVNRGIIQGYENMFPTAVSQLIEQTMKFVFGLLFAYVLSKSGNGIVGTFLGITISEIVCLFYLMMVMNKNFKMSSKRKIDKEFFSAVVPLTAASSIIPLANAIEAFFIVFILGLAGFSNQEATILYGLQTGVVGAIMHFPLIISVAVSSALLPKISFLSSKDNLQEQKSVISKVFGVMWFFIFPLTVGLISISSQLYPLLYPRLIDSHLSLTLNLTFLSGISTLLNAVYQILNIILLAKGFFKSSVIFACVGVFFKITLLFGLGQTSVVGIYAIAISNIALYSFANILILTKLGSLIKVDYFEFFLPIIASLIMYYCVKIILSFVGGIVGVTLSIFAGAIVYFVISLPLTKEYAREFFKKMKLSKRKI